MDWDVDLDDGSWCSGYKGPKKNVKPKFSAGDIVRLKKGKSPIHVSYVIGGEVFGFYSRTGQQVENRSQDDFELYEGEDTMRNGAKLYQVTSEENVYGTYLATNSSGQYVLEMSGDKSVKAFRPDNLEEVLPYTFSVKFDFNSKTYHFLGAKGDYAVGDLLYRYDSGYPGFAVVDAVDTKSKSATKTFKGYKLKCEKLG